MGKRKIYGLAVGVLTMLVGGAAFAATAGDVTVNTTKKGATVTVDKVIADGKLLLSVEDAKNQPILGLGVQDFSVKCKADKARAISVQSVAEVVEVPQNIVMVLDNSDSMYTRNAIKPLLAGVDKVFSLVRPGDNVQMVVFNEKMTSKLGDKDVRVETFSSNDPAALKEFAKNAYSLKKLTARTYLYDSVLTGVNLISKLPADSPRTLIIFTDGEDIGSVYKRADVVKAVKAAGKFKAYGIDYMPDTPPNKDLKQLVEARNGKIWKTKSDIDIEGMWAQVATTLDYSYILTYACTPPPVVLPVVLVAKDIPKKAEAVPVLAVFEESVFFDFDKSELKPKGKEKLKEYREQAKGLLNSASKVKITGHTDSIGSAEYNLGLSQRRAEAVAEYIKSLGVDPAKLEVKGEGKARPIFDNRTKEGRAKNRRVEIEVTGTLK